MKRFQEGHYEYVKVMFGLAQKAHEIKQGFDKLSREDKCRVENKLKKIIDAQGITGGLNILIYRVRRRYVL